MSDLFQPSTSEMIAELEREIRMREQVYPGLVRKGSLAQNTANRRIAVMKAMVTLLKDIPR